MNEGHPLRLMGTLGGAGLLSGLVLVGTFLATEPQIARNRAERLERAVYTVLPGAERQAPFVDGRLVEGEVPEGDVVYAGFDADGRFVGFAIPAEGSGFQDTIKLLFGFVPAEQTVIGMVVLESRETPGLGDKIIKDAHFVDQFEQLAAVPDIVATRRGADAPNEVDAISGATISSKAVVRIINQAHAHWAERLPAAVVP